MIKTIAFDLDGVLVRAVGIHKEAFNKALWYSCRFYLSDEEHEQIFNGLPTKKKLEILYNQGRVKKEQFAQIEYLKQAFTVTEIVENIKPDPEKEQLHRYLQSHNIIECCVTNSIRPTTELMLHLSGQLTFMKFVITNQDVEKPKPSPEGYDKAIKILGLHPEECIIVEDSPKGKEAAYKTGAWVWEVLDQDAVHILGLQKFMIENGLNFGDE